MDQQARGLVSVVFGVFVGFALAFLFSPDPTGLFPIVAGVILTGVLSAAFYLGISRAISSEPE